MAKLCPLFSGSKGNSYYIGCSGQAILIDAGKSAKQIENILSKNHLPLSDIRAIFISHEHSDHISALKTFASRYKIKVYMSEGTKSILQRKGVITEDLHIEIIGANQTVNIDNMEISTFSLSHDCAEGIGFRIHTADNNNICVATDLGYISDEVLMKLKGCNAIVIESNHDIGMLENSFYPYSLKRRILSDVGHLSNMSCSAILPFLASHGTTRFMLAHLSQENNMPQIAYQTALMSLEENGFKNGVDFLLDVAPPVNEGNHTFIL